MSVTKITMAKKTAAKSKSTSSGKSKRSDDRGEEQKSMRVKDEDMEVDLSAMPDASEGEAEEASEEAPSQDDEAIISSIFNAALTDQDDDYSVPLEPNTASERAVFVRGRVNQPSYSFHNLPPFQCRNMREDDHQLTNCSYFEYTIEVPFQICEDNHSSRASLAEYILYELHSFLEDSLKPLSILNDCKINVISNTSSNSHIVSILWPRRDYIASMSKLCIKFNDDRYYLRFLKPCIDKSYRTIGINMDPNKSIDTFLGLFGEAIKGRASIVDIWKLEGYNDEHQLFKWTGEVRILVAINIKYMPPRNFPRKRGNFIKTICGALPGYIYYEGEPIMLQYQDRSLWCTRCKPSVDKYHSTPYCPVHNALM